MVLQAGARRTAALRLSGRLVSARTIQAAERRRVALLTLRTARASATTLAAASRRRIARRQLDRAISSATALQARVRSKHENDVDKSELLTRELRVLQYVSKRGYVLALHACFLLVTRQPDAFKHKRRFGCADHYQQQFFCKLVCARPSLPIRMRQCELSLFMCKRLLDDAPPSGWEIRFEEPDKLWLLPAYKRQSDVPSQ
ncbi:hypothetical protein AB1Y20_008497 [Prymnesium parvum]